MSSTGSKVVPESGFEPTQPPGARTTVKGFSRHQGLFIFCIVLHLLLIGAHVALIVVEFDHDQHLARDTLATDLIFLAIVMIPGVIIKVPATRPSCVFADGQLIVSRHTLSSSYWLRKTWR